MLRYKIYVLFLFIIGICMMDFAFAETPDLPLLGKVIYIDAGHGGVDPGAMYKDIMEKDINLSISKILEEKLVKAGAIVYLTRYGDYDLAVNNTINRKRSDLSRRGNIINRSGCDLFVSIHLNAESTGIWRGPQVFYDDINDKNEILAEILQTNLNKNLKSNRKYKLTNDMYLQKRIKRPGVLIEVGFLSNANDRYLLKKKEYQDRVSTIIMNSIIDYFDQI